MDFSINNVESIAVNSLSSKKSGQDCFTISNGKITFNKL